MVDTRLGDRPMYNICPVFFRPPEPVYCIPKRLLSALEQDVLLPHTDYIFNRLYLQQVDYLQQIIFNRLFQRQEGLKGQDMGIGGFLVCSSCVFFLLCQG